MKQLLWKKKLPELNSNSEAVHNNIVEAEVENFKYQLRQNHPSFLITCGNHKMVSCTRSELKMLMNTGISLRSESNKSSAHSATKQEVGSRRREIESSLIERIFPDT